MDAKEKCNSIIKLARELELEQGLSFDQALMVLQIESTWSLPDYINYMD